MTEDTTTLKPRRIAVHTVYRKEDKRWHNKMAGITISSHRKERVAIDKGREYAKQEKTLHRIHNNKGVIVKVKNYIK